MSFCAERPELVSLSLQKRLTLFFPSPERRYDFGMTLSVQTDLVSWLSEWAMITSKKNRRMALQIVPTSDPRKCHSK
jgi:hypothetical protein